MMVVTPSSREGTATDVKNDQASKVNMATTPSSREEVATATKNDQASKVNMAITPSSREGTATAVKNDQASDLFLCYVHKPQPNYAQNINKNKVYIMKYELICYILSHAHKIKIYDIFKTCVFTLFNISYLKLSVHLYCIFLQTNTNILCHFFKCKF